MRLDAIHSARAVAESVIPVCTSTDISGQVLGKFRLVGNEPFRRRITRFLATSALTVQQRRLAGLLTCPLSFEADALCLDERFGDDASAAAMFRVIGGKSPERVLVPGCYLGGEDVQFWLRRGVKRLDGVDLNSLAARWSLIVPELRREFSSEVHFQQAPLEKLPFSSECFDVIASSGVLEHVQNLGAISAETARVLKRGGVAWHRIGPLYFSFGADHCIDAYGQDCGYDHLLLSEAEYQSRIGDQAFYDKQSDPNLPFWARHNQFSFAYAREYLEWFRRYFRVRHVVAKISEAGLQFRSSFPKKWNKLLRAGIAEEDLLIKGLSVVLEKT